MGFYGHCPYEKRRSNMLVLEIKAIVLSWWASKTHVNPNKKKVVRRRLTPKV
jgi:hypothetical protein